MTQPFRAVIAGTGSYVPERIVTNDDLSRLVDTSDEWIRTRTGIRERRVLADEQATSDMCLEAARQALVDARVSPEEIDLIIVATVTPDMLFPSTACLVQEKLGAVNAAAFDLSAGCTGFIYGLATGSQFLETGLYRTALVIGADALSRIVNWSDRSTCVLFGDGAGAVVLQGIPGTNYGILGSYLKSDGGGAGLLCLPGGGSRRPPSPASLAAGLHYLHMEGKEVFKFAVKAMEDATTQTLQVCGLTEKDVDFLIPHQANMRIVEAALKRLELPRERVIVNLDKYGNMSSASVPVAMDEAARLGRLRRGDVLLLVAFGAGLTWGGVALKWAK
ncbi:MAG TPA: ketoacyl-ACP synthase III [Clostridia bacterium]|nr:ketoacyl-ACP synthase III [Clostridia bacterium]